MALDLRPPMGPILSAFGVAARVTVPHPNDDTTLDATLVWVSPESAAVPGGDAPLTRIDAKRFAALTRAEVPRVPRGTKVVAPEFIGGPEGTWLVDSTVRVEFDHVVVCLVPND